LNVPAFPTQQQELRIYGNEAIFPLILAKDNLVAHKQISPLNIATMSTSMHEDTSQFVGMRRLQGQRNELVFVYTNSHTKTSSFRCPCNRRIPRHSQTMTFLELCCHSARLRNARCHISSPQPQSYTATLHSFLSKPLELHNKENRSIIPQTHHQS
jgi:hypothetical protein